LNVLASAGTSGVQRLAALQWGWPILVLRLHKLPQILSVLAMQ
jgi:hypothetical protein